ncbi:MAG: DEAD/DEAH box helicase, partial [Dehalococcoidia bacterium]|nr:DEAD/DEAH box helicase [Dehalococcoidia bacterium]
DRSELARLKRQLEAVTAERNHLRAENRRLCQTTSESLKVSPPDFNVAQDHYSVAVLGVADTLRAINEESPLADKVRLLRSLFRGREDLFARLWWSKTSHKIGYSPVCSHRWDPVLCSAPSVKCGECANRDFTPVSDKVVQYHLEGKHTIGIYPLLQDDTFHLLAVDFDKQSWMEDAAAFLGTCRRMGVPAVLERSRSGNGAHVWVFFSEAVPASAARKLGSYLLTETMSRRHQLGMDSYDRLFPNQDSLPKRGFGNLIALPLQKEPAERGNSLFLDDNLEPHVDQWAFLASVVRLAPSSLEDLVRAAIRQGQVVGVRISPDGEEDQPWAVMAQRRMLEPSMTGPLPSKVTVVMGNLLFVEKEGLPSSLLNQIKRLAAFQNPEFYKKQSLRLSTALTPRVICCAEEFPRHLGIPRGCLDQLQALLQTLGIDLDLKDERLQSTRIEAVFCGELTPSQEAAIAELTNHDNGVLVAPSGSGKTVVGISMVAARGTNTLVVVHRGPLLEQWRVQLANFLAVDPAKIGQIGGGKDKRSGFVDVAMLQSLVRKGSVKDFVADYGHVIVDECHHLPAVTFEQVLRRARARYVLGLTATPYRRDGQQPIILMQCGPVRHVISQKDHGDQASLRHLLIVRETDFELPAGEHEPSIHHIYAALADDEARNQLILDDLLQAIEEGRSPIVLTERRTHLEFFAKRLDGAVPNVVVLHGGMGSRQRRELAEQMSGIPDGANRVLLATGRYIGEGFDDARLDTLFLAMPVSWKGTLVQYAGRLHRLHSGKVEVRIYDYVDRGNPTLLRMFNKRLRGYRAMGYEATLPGAGHPLMLDETSPGSRTIRRD